MTRRQDCWLALKSLRKRRRQFMNKSRRATLRGLPKKLEQNLKKRETLSKQTCGKGMAKASLKSHSLKLEKPLMKHIMYLSKAQTWRDLK